MRVFKFLLAALVLALAIPAASFGQVRVGVAVSFGPPAIPVYEQPICPGDDYLWTPGYWGWDADAGDYYWVPGTWVMAPEAGFLWTPGYWGWREGGFFWNDGFWGRRSASTEASTTGSATSAAASMADAGIAATSSITAP